MNFRAFVKAIKADVGKKELTLSFTMEMTPESMEQAEMLARFANADSPAVELSVELLQKSMSMLDRKD